MEAGAEFVVDLVQAFLDDAPALLGSLRSAMAAGDATAFRRAAHSLKSNSLTFGAGQLATLARDLESRAAEVVGSGDAAALEAISTEFTRVATALPGFTSG